MKKEKLEFLLETAEQWSKDFHADQKYAYNEPYFEAHIQKVVAQVMYLTKSDRFTLTEKYLAIIVAYLHDTVEDTELTITAIERTFGSMIAQSVLNLTKTAKESYESQWSRAKRDPISLVVKQADMMVNLSASLSNNRTNLITKYLDGLGYLSL